ncbi:MAG: MFS transporter [Coriobacteriia bacterium]|nr:MFS transporter [Coriobacteriia bacterium]
MDFVKPPLQGKAKNLYGVSDFAFSLMANIENYFLMFFLTNVAKLPLAGIASATSLAYTGDAIGQGIYAGIISAVKPMRWGKNRSYILLFGPLVVITFVLTFSKIGSDAFALFVCGSMLFLTNMTRTFTWTSNLNLVNVLASNADDRSLLASRRATWTAASGMIYSYAVIPNIARLQQVMPDTMVYTFLAFITSAFYMLMCWVVFWITSGYEATGEAAKAQGASAAQQIGLLDILKSAVQNPYLLVILVGALISSCFGAGATSAITYYYNYIGKPHLFPLQVFLGAAVGTVSSFFAGQVGKKISSKNAVLLGTFGMCACNIACSFVAIPSNELMVAILTFRNVFQGINGPNLIALYGDCAVYARWKTGKETSAFVMGSQTIPLKIGLMLRGILVPLILAISGFDASIPPAEAGYEVKNGIITMFFRLPAIGGAIYGLILLLGFRLNRERVAEMQKEIDEREAAQALEASA